mmetsp:Transcript_80182/g.227004  ORF Transcript_80182/g.227004 Transcript_80182/m.227004 type:complete len:502 (-) Transcript_80182:106-1611(-)|eukprot:CAMPEP_0179220828 /NCGR_PEP_ID=MMETSP0797-20121207/5848_1 /TAXON_ID=47934 /ORGANISM="Dinophysis acuminata, Strain DAEP01" /LENGTH=501 /DNA_ID=CAMNT_0020927535 /DNA_START=41 /DNA_END=1546 /DNA_ORIENTATION=+
MAKADMSSQAFWGEFMRRPDAKRAQESEKQLTEKKKLWLEERQAIEERGERRKKVADALEECPADVKKLIAPMFHIRIVEQFMWEVYEDCWRNYEQTLPEFRTETFGMSFGKRLKDERTMSELLHFRTNFQEGGEARMEDLERQMHAINTEIALDEERKREVVPAPIDMHTLKELLEFGQQCRSEGNAKFKEGLYEEALEIYAQGDEAMKKWKVEKHLKNEHKWLTDNHIACLNNKAQAALRLELFQTALEASEAALKLDDEDHKAWYRKVQAQKGLGKFKEAEDSLAHLEDVAQWCPDRRRILKDCETERKKIKYQRAKHKHDTREMLGKAFEAGLFSLDRERELEEATKSLEAPPQKANSLTLEQPAKKQPLKIEAQKPLERNIHLTAALAGDLMDELAEAYKQKWFQERVRKCARDSGFERSVFLMRLKDIAFDVQKPVLEKWGFEGNEHGVREMTAAIRDHAQNGQDMPDWLKQKQDRCLELLYGGKEGGMLEILTQ